MGRMLAYLWVNTVMVATSWLPDFKPCIRLRGFLLRPAFKRCGRNFQVCRHVMIAHSTRISVGRDVFIGYGTWLNGSAGITIEDEVQFGPYCVAITGNHGKRNLSYRWGHGKRGPVHIGTGAWVAAHAVLLADVRIGRGSLVAANAVVVDSIPEHCIAGGIPAKVLREDVGDDDEASPNYGVPPSKLANDDGLPQA